MKGDHIATLAFIAVVWAGIFATYEPVVSSDQKWHDRGYGAIEQKAWSDWKASHPYGDHQSEDFMSRNPSLDDPDHDPRNEGSFWEEPYSEYVLIVPAVFWVMLLVWFTMPKVVLAPVVGAKRLGVWARTVRKDDWFKVALIASILVAAAIVAVAMQYRRGE